MKDALKTMALAIFSVTLLVQGCSKSAQQNEAETAAPTPAAPAASPLTGFERDLQFVRNGRFTYIRVFSRKDGKPLDREDAAFLRQHAPQVVDWVTSENGKKVIGGSNFNLEEGGMAELRKRFIVEDYSAK